MSMDETGRDLASIADLCARRPRFRAGRGRLADHDRRRALSRFHLRRRRQCARPRPSASGRGADRAGARSSGTSPTSTAFPKASGWPTGCARLSFADTVFFQNSGAEAIECAIKMARKYQFVSGKPERFRIITFEGAFHGRTLAAIAATGNKKYLEGFGPPVEGFDQVPFADLEATKKAIGPETAAILIEPIMGEGGVRVVPHTFPARAAQAVRRPRPAADLRRGADRHRPHRRLVRLSAHRRDARHHGAGQGARRRLSDRRLPGDGGSRPRA